MIFRLLTLAVLVAPATAHAHRYHVALSDDLRTMNVEACFDAAPRSLRAGSQSAREFLGPVEAVLPDGTTRNVRIRRGAIPTSGLPDASCVRYSVDAGRAADRRAARRNRWVGEDLLTTPETWLWRSTDADDGRRMTVEFELPDGVEVSAPWQPDPRNARRFRVGPAPYQWSAIVAFGRFAERPIEVPGATIRLAVVAGDDRRVEPDALAEWIEEAALAVTTLYGSFPQPAPQVLVVPSARGGGPVPWGQVLRGGAPAAHFFVNPDRPITAFRADWTAAHELSHMLLPLVRRSDRWLSEGFASYYQNVLRARAGMLDERIAWEKLHQGFLRGQAGNSGRPLRETSRDMHRNRAYMRVYWSGAAIALLADVRLRELSDGKQSLDTALEELKDCCLDVGRIWSARELFERFDRMTDTKVFTTLYDEHVNAREFPDVAPRFEALGIAARGRRVTLTRDAPLAWIRQAIMTTPAAAKSAARRPPPTLP